MAVPEGDENDELSELQEELESARLQLAELEGLLGELPELFENKFQERLQPVLEQQRLIAEENQSLFDQIQIQRALQGSEPVSPRPALPSVSAGGAPPPPPQGAAIKEPVPSPPPKAPATVKPIASTDEPVHEAQLVTWRDRVAWRPLGVLVGLAGLVAATTAGLMLGWAWLTERPKPVGAQAEAVAKVGNSELLLRSRDKSWVAVRSLEGRPLFEGILEGNKSFPIGEGLQVISGRADLVSVQVGNRPPVPLGRVDQVFWRTFKPDQPPAPAGQ